MRLWRICRQAFADLSGDGARLYGGRWNSPGRPLVYTADSAALAVLEVRVHLDLTWDLLPADFVLVEIDSASAETEDAAQVDHEIAYGDACLKSLRTPLLRVPSAIIPENSNVLINPVHPASGSITIRSIRPFAFDARLWLPKL